MRWLAAPFLALVLVPAAHAALTVQVTPASIGPIPPETGTGHFVVRLGLDCATATQMAGPQQPIPMQVALNATDRDVAVQGPSTVLLNTTACVVPTATASQNATYVVTANRQALGFVASRVQVKATASGVLPASPGAQSAKAALNVTVGYFGYVQAETPTSTLRFSPGHSATFAVHVENLGNAPTLLSFRLQEEPTSRWRVVLPPPLLLDPAPGDSSATASVLVTYAGSFGMDNAETALRLVVSGQAAADPGAQAPPVTLTLMAHVNGLSAPSPALPLGAMALLGAALVVARRRSR